MRVAALFLTLLGGMGSILPDVPLEPVGTIEDYKYKNKFEGETIYQTDYVEKEIPDNATHQRTVCKTGF